MIRKILGKLVLIKKAKHTINYLLLEFSNRIQLSYALGQPVVIHLEPTNYCNSKCVMCPGVYGGLKKRIVPKHMHMSFEDFKRIIAQFPYCKVICLYGLGEPLLNPDVIKMIKLCKGKGIFVSLTTNGSTLSRNISKELVLSGLDEIWFSIDGGTAKTFEKIRVGTRFSTVIENIKRFIELKNNLNSERPKPKVRTIVSNENIHEIPQLLRLVKSIGIKDITVRGGDFSGTPLNAVPNEQLNVLLKHKSYGESLGLNVKLLFPTLPPLSNRKKIICWKLWKSTYITVGGWVTPCCRLPFEKDLTGGNILNQDFKKIWNNRMYRRLRKKFGNNESAFCQNCISGTS